MRKRNVVQEWRRRVPSSEATVDSCSDTAILSIDDSVVLHPHRLERDLRHRLMSEPSLNFQSLVVRRIADGVCLEGVLELSDEQIDVEELVRQTAGVQRVLNCLVVRQPHQCPPKG